MAQTVVGGVVIEKLPNGTHAKCGIWEQCLQNDYKGRARFGKEWMPFAAYKVPHSFNIHTAKNLRRDHPKISQTRMVRYFYTFKYAALLARHRPDLYIQLHGIPADDVRAQLLFKNHIALKLRGEL